MIEELKPCPEMIEKVGEAVAAEIDAIDEELATCVNALDRDEWRKAAAERIARAAITAYDPDKRLREALEKCRDKFREYEQHHYDESQKIFHDGSGQGLLGAEIQAMNDRRAKAERNREMADMIDAALSHNGG